MVELESSSNVRFLHARAEAKSLSAITSLGGAGAGGAADEAHYLWPKYAAGMTYNSSFVDSLFGQAFYRPSRWVDFSVFPRCFFFSVPLGGLLSCRLLVIVGPGVSAVGGFCVCFGIRLERGAV